MYKQEIGKPAYFPDAADDTIDLQAIWGGIWRSKFILLLGLLAGAAVGIANVVATTPVYSSSATVRLGSPEAEDARAVSGVTTGVADAEVTTEIEVILSERIAERVVDALDLTESEAFFHYPETGTSRFIGFVLNQLRVGVRYAEEQLDYLFIRQDERAPVIAADPPTEEQLDTRRQAIAILRSRMSVGQVRGTLILSIGFTSVSPALSARVANGIANAYIEDQLAMRFDATQRATEWLGERARQLGEQTARLDREIEAFKRENDLVEVSNGDIDSSRTLDSLNQRLAEARATIVDLEARSRRLDEIVEAEDTTAVVSSTASQGITSNLRSRYLETLGDYNTMRDRLGEGHEQTQRRRRELDDLQALMFEEIKRSADLLRSDLQVERTRLASLEEAQEAAESRVGADTRTLVELRELERHAETVRGLFTSYQQRYQQSLQENNFTVSDAYILNPARPSGVPSAPNFQRTVAFAALVGLMLAAALALLRELRDNRLRSEEQVRRELGMEYLGTLPRLRGKQAVTSARQLRDKDPGPREVLLSEINRYVIDKPFSGFAETLHAGQLSVKLRQGTRRRAPIVGFVSAFTGEGKTTLAANFAALCAKQGASVMLIDADLRNPGLSRTFGVELQQGLVDVLIDGAPWQDCYQTNQDTGLHILGMRRERVTHTSIILGGPAMEVLLDDLSAKYDYVILDLPPLGLVVDTRAILHKLDGVFIVARWAGSPVKLLQKILQTEHRLWDKSYGVFLNMFEARKAKAYGIYQGAQYDPSGYQRYHDGD